MNQKPSKRNFQNYRAPKLGELLNIFHTSEEVENKKMFEVKEKDYNMRMIESHIFPKRHSIEFLNKLYNLLKNKDPNYYLKRKYINHANFENNENGKFRLTLSKSFYKKLVSEGEINIYSKRVVSLLNENIAKKQQENNKDNISSHELENYLLKDCHFNQALKEIYFDEQGNVGLESSNENKSEITNIHLTGMNISNEMNKNQSNLDIFKQNSNMTELDLNKKKSQISLEKRKLSKNNQVENFNNKFKSFFKDDKIKVETQIKEKRDLKDLVPEFFLHTKKQVVEKESDSDSENYDTLVYKNEPINTVETISTNTARYYLKENYKNTNKNLLENLKFHDDEKLKLLKNQEDKENLKAVELELIDKLYKNSKKIIPEVENFIVNDTTSSYLYTGTGENLLTSSDVPLSTNNNKILYTLNSTSSNKNKIKLPEIENIKNYRKNLNLIKDSFNIQFKYYKKKKNDILTKQILKPIYEKPNTITEANEIFSSFETKRESVTDTYKKMNSFSKKSKSVNKKIQNDDNSKMYDPQCMFIYEKHKWEKLKNNNVIFLIKLNKIANTLKSIEKRRIDVFEKLNPNYHTNKSLVYNFDIGKKAINKKNSLVPNNNRFSRFDN